MSDRVQGSRRFIEEARAAIAAPDDASDGLIVSVLLQAWREASAENERLRAALVGIAGCPDPNSVENCHDRMYDIAIAALHPQEHTDE